MSEIETKRLQQQLGALLYLCNIARPDLSHCLQKVATNMSAPTISDSDFLKQIFRYVKQTKSCKLIYKKRTTHILESYSDADFGGDKITYRSVSGSIHLLYGNPISWTSKKQSWVALSTAESEMNALVECVREITWLQLMLLEMKLCDTSFLPTIHVDNKAAIFISESYKTNRNVRHVGVRIAFLRERLNHSFKLSYIVSALNLADVFTKAVSPTNLKKFRDLVFSIEK